MRTAGIERRSRSPRLQRRVGLDRCRRCRRSWSHQRICARTASVSGGTADVRDDPCQGRRLWEHTSWDRCFGRRGIRPAWPRSRRSGRESAARRAPGLERAGRALPPARPRRRRRLPAQRARCRGRGPDRVAASGREPRPHPRAPGTAQVADHHCRQRVAAADAYRAADLLIGVLDEPVQEEHGRAEHRARHRPAAPRAGRDCAAGARRASACRSSGCSACSRANDSSVTGRSAGFSRSRSAASGRPGARGLARLRRPRPSGTT